MQKAARVRQPEGYSFKVIASFLKEKISLNLLFPLGSNNLKKKKKTEQTRKAHFCHDHHKLFQK
jgi:hypothetical protein